MGNNIKDILSSEIKSISHVKHDEKKFCAIFHLEKGINFKGEITHDRYTFTPVKQSQLPEIKQIIWKKEYGSIHILILEIGWDMKTVH